jgi:hypothetical protein
LSRSRQLDDGHDRLHKPHEFVQRWMWDRLHKPHEFVQRWIWDRLHKPLCICMWICMWERQLFVYPWDIYLYVRGTICCKLRELFV